MLIRDPLRDKQAAPPLDYCERCGGELYGSEAEPDENGRVYCPECGDALDGVDEHARWLEARKNGLGGSDAAAVLGLNPWKTNVALWEEKTGKTEPEDISAKPVILYGKAAEKPLRMLFRLDFPQYVVDYDEFGMRSQPDRPWLFATLDGEITERETRRRGVLEIKTTEIMRSGDWAKWEDKVPDYYYTQILHQLLATGYDFAVLKAQIKWHKDGKTQVTVRHYHFERQACAEDLDYLLEAETRFWECVQNGRKPDLILPGI